MAGGSQEWADEDGVIHAGPRPAPIEGEGRAGPAEKLRLRARRPVEMPAPAAAEGGQPAEGSPRARLMRLRGVQRPELPAPQVEAPERPEPPKAAIRPAVSGTSEAFAEVMKEARQALVAALGREAIRDTDARWFIGAIAAAVTAIDAAERRADERQRELVEVLQRIVMDAEVRLRSPYSPEERKALRLEVSQAAAGSLPSAEERAAMAASLTGAVERVLAPLVERARAVDEARAAGAGAAVPSQEAVLRVVASGARLAVAQALTPETVQRVTIGFGAWLAGAFAAGCVFVALAAAAARALGWR